MPNVVITNNFPFLYAGVVEKVPRSAAMESTNQEGRVIRVPQLKRGKEETAIPDRVSLYFQS